MGTGHGAMERTSLHNDSLLYASLIAILLLISYWFTTRCFKIISGIEGTGQGMWGDRVAQPGRFHKPSGEVSQMIGEREVDWGLPLWEISISSVTSLAPPGRGPALMCESSLGTELWLRAVSRAAPGSTMLLVSRYCCPLCQMGM